MISIAREVLYRLQYIEKFQRRLHHVIFIKCVKPHFGLLKRVVRHRFECSHLIELKILSKMSGRAALHDFPVRSYQYDKSRKNPKNHQKSWKIGWKHVFSNFCHTDNFSLESRGEPRDHSFCLEFSALSDGCIRNDVWQLVLKVKNGALRIL